MQILLSNVLRIFGISNMVNIQPNMNRRTYEYEKSHFSTNSTFSIPLLEGNRQAEVSVEASQMPHILYDLLSFTTKVAAEQIVVSHMHVVSHRQQQVFSSSTSFFPINSQQTGPPKMSDVQITEDEFKLPDGVPIYRKTWAVSLSSTLHPSISLLIQTKLQLTTLLTALLLHNSSRKTHLHPRLQRPHKQVLRPIPVSRRPRHHHHRH